MYVYFFSNHSHNEPLKIHSTNIFTLHLSTDSFAQLRNVRTTDVPSKIEIVTRFYAKLERSLEKIKSPRILLVLPSSQNGISVGCSNLDDDAVLKSYFSRIGSVTPGLSNVRTCGQCTSSSDFDLHLGFIQRLGLRFSPVTMERQNENVSVFVGKIISKMINLLDDLIVIVVGPTERIDIAKHLLVEDHGTNTSTTCGDEEDVRPIRTMLNEINTIEASRTNANLIQCQFVTYKKTTTTRTKKKKSRVIIPNVENILGPL